MHVRSVRAARVAGTALVAIRGDQNGVRRV
jgi:hypothetical protein